MIIDGHVHISESDFGNVDVLIPIMDKIGIEKAVIVPGGMIDVRKMSRYLHHQDKANTNRIPNHLTLQAAKKYPNRFLRYLCFDPYSFSEKEADELCRETKNGTCFGIKLAPIVHGFPFTLGTVTEIARLAGNLGIPVYTHVLSEPGKTLSDFEKVVKENPKTIFILGHMGVGPADMDAVLCAARNENLYLETSGGSYMIVNAALKKVGSSKLIFGSEFPLYHPAAEITKIKELPASDGELENILGGTINALHSSRHNDQR